MERPVVPGDTHMVARVLCEAYRAMHHMGIEKLHEKLQTHMACCGPTLDAVVIAVVIEMDEYRRMSRAGTGVVRLGKMSGKEQEILDACIIYSDPEVMGRVLEKIVRAFAEREVADVR